VIFSPFSRNFNFLREKHFFYENPVLEPNFHLFWSKPHFSGSGPPKNLPEACVYKGFWAGLPKDRFWAKKSLLGTRNAKNCEILLILGKRGKYLKKLGGSLKNHQETIGLRKVLSRCRIAIFGNFQLFT
jgi:hypothetical protein